MERTRKEDVYINWYYLQELAGWGENEVIHAFTKPNLEPGTSGLSERNQIHQLHEMILSTGQQEFLG